VQPPQAEIAIGERRTDDKQEERKRQCHQRRPTPPAMIWIIVGRPSASWWPAERWQPIIEWWLTTASWLTLPGSALAGPGGRIEPVLILGRPSAPAPSVIEGYSAGRHQFYCLLDRLAKLDNARKAVLRIWRQRLVQHCYQFARQRRRVDI